MIENISIGNSFEAEKTENQATAEVVSTFSSGKEKNVIKKGVLYLVATPIGNLSDLSERAIKVMRDVDFIAAEDTRVSVKMLSYLGISKPMVSYYEHNKRERGEVIVAKLKNGESCALITDAGTPAISDPGEDLVRLCAEENVEVISIPGPCALVVALTVSALATGRFTFEGFLPMAKGERRERLAEIKDEKRTMIFYEAPHKLRATLKDLLATFGDRQITFCRELTKLNEDVFRTTLEAANIHFEKNDPRGEYVLVIEGAKTVKENQLPFWTNMAISDHVEYYINQGQSKKDAIKTVAKERGLVKNDVYQEVL